MDVEEMIAERKELLGEMLKAMREVSEDVALDPGQVEAVFAQKLLLSSPEQYVFLPEKERESSLQMDTRRLKECTDFLGEHLQGRGQGVVFREEAVENRICVLSQRPIEVPVVAPCGHVFDRKALAFFFRQAKKKKVGCLFKGCAGTLADTMTRTDPSN